VTLSAVKDLETLSTGLSRKIWQKIIILKSMQQVPGEASGGAAHGVLKIEGV
jgi:hypothetical protein